jgi:hypothetical protein
MRAKVNTCLAEIAINLSNMSYVCHISYEKEQLIVYNVLAESATTLVNTSRSFVGPSPTFLEITFRFNVLVCSTMRIISEAAD